MSAMDNPVFDGQRAARSAITDGETGLKIAVIAHVRHPIGEPFMGGMEAHSASLVRNLAEAGDDVTLFASGDSKVASALHPIARQAYEFELPWSVWHGSPELAAWLRSAYSRAWDAIRGGAFDVVHNNSLFPELHDWAARDGVPMLTSLHIPPFQALRDAVARNDAPWHQLTVTSQSQLGLWRGASEARTSVAYNGIDLERFPFDGVGGDRPFWCGRITPTKGTLDAVTAAKAAGIPLDIAGPIDCEDYFAALRPLLDEQRRYLGHLSAEEVARRMARAAYFICTPCWDEPFGLVAAEAMACGTPVLAYDRGALREVVGEAGILVPDWDGLVAAMRQGIAVPRHLCRARCERLFGEAAMMARYRSLYATAIEAAEVARASSSSITRAELA